MDTNGHQFPEKRGDTDGADHTDVWGAIAVLRMLFFENLHNVLRINANGLTPAEKEDHVEILGRTKLTGLVEQVSRAVR
jgi:hypothetical protein